jgi:hypothetical protein
MHDSASEHSSGKSMFSRARSNILSILLFTVQNINEIGLGLHKTALKPPCPGHPSRKKPTLSALIKHQ